MSSYDLLPLGIAALVLLVMLRPRIRAAREWRATVTPLASIIGSGFLIVAPLLAAAVGGAADVAMLAIVLLSLWVGTALRYNIRHDGRNLNTPALPGAAALERLANTALAGAYAISVSFYLRLMAAFVLNIFGINGEFEADLLAICVVMFIGIYGWRRGLLALERLEEYSVTVKLAIIAALLLWLAGYDWDNGYTLSGLQSQQQGLIEQLRLLGGMLLVVQGFETSRYLGQAYGPELRARTMLRAQLLAGIIYVVFVALVMPLTTGRMIDESGETAIIDISAIVTPLLPPLLVLAAVMSQFSAAVADTIGAGGLVQQESRSRISNRVSYLLLALASCLLILFTNIFELVAIASRAFAFYYLLEAVLALRLSSAFERGNRRRLMRAGYAVLSVVLLLIVVFGKAVGA